jgi:hypothetical protein
MDQAAITNLLVAAVIALISFAAYAGRKLVDVGVKYLEAKLGSTQFSQISERAETMVRYLEQSPIFKDFDGAKKFELLKIDLIKFAADKGIPLSDADLNKIGEAAVRVVKKEIGTVDWGANDEDIDALTSSIIDQVTGAN